MITKGHVFSFLSGVVFTVGVATGAAYKADVEATIDRLGHQIDTLGVKHAMEHPSPSNVDPTEEPDLRRFSRRNTADNLYSPDDHAEFSGRHDTFDRRPSSGKEGRP